MKAFSFFLGTVITTLLFTSPAIHAAESSADANLAEMWVMKVERGKEAAFETAFKKHLEERAKKGDPRAWQTWTAVTGDEFGNYYVRYCCFAWKDLDSYEKWTMDSKIMEHWNKHVDAHVAGYEHHFARIDMTNSHWPETANDYPMVGVSHYLPKMGTYQALEKSKKALSDAAKAMKWPYHWAWDSPINGAPGLSLVIPYKNYADMAPPEKPFSEMLAKHLGSEEKAAAMLKDWMSHFETVHYQVYRWRTDLSMPMKK